MFGVVVALPSPASSGPDKEHNDHTHVHQAVVRSVGGPLHLELVVDIARVQSAVCHFGLELDFHLLVEQPVPVHVLEERVGLDVLAARGPAAQPLLGVAREQGGQQGAGRVLQEGGKA
jgi:hypothetical protein